MTNLLNTTEKKLFLIFSKTSLAKGEKTFILDLLQNQYDFKKFISLFLSDFSASLLIMHFNNIKECENKKNTKNLQDILTYLDKMYEKEKSLLYPLYDESKKVLEYLHNSGLKVVVMKGKSYDLFVYHNSSYERITWDLDIIVSQQDIRLAHKLLVDYGFSNPMTDDTLIEYIAEPHHHLRIYRKELSKNSTCCIEIHKDTIFPGELSLKALYNDSTEIDKINYINNLDLCILSAHHLYSHLPVSVRNLKYNFLKLIMDLFESYNTIDDKNKLNKRIKKLGVERVFTNMLSLVKKYYSGNEFSNTNKFNVRKSNYDLFDLFLNKREIIKDIKNCNPFPQSVLNIDCYKNTDGRADKHDWYYFTNMNVIQEDSVVFWPSPYYLQLSEIEYDIEINFNVSYSDEYLIFNVKGNNLGNFSNGVHGFHDIYSHFIVKLGYEYNKPTQQFLLQPKMGLMDSIYTYGKFENALEKPLCDKNSFGNLLFAKNSYNFCGIINKKSIDNYEVMYKNRHFYMDFYYFHINKNNFYNNAIMCWQNGFNSDYIFNKTDCNKCVKVNFID